MPVARLAKNKVHHAHGICSAIWWPMAARWIYQNRWYERTVHDLIVKPDFDVDAVLAAKTRFCVFRHKQCDKKFYSKHAGTRVALLDAISKEYKKVDALGICRGDRDARLKYNIEPTNRHHLHYTDSSVDTFAQYKFSFAMENNFVDGYWTEKMINGIYSHTVPIMAGFKPKADSTMAEYINMDRVIYCQFDIQTYPHTHTPPFPPPSSPQPCACVCFPVCLPLARPRSRTILFSRRPPVPADRQCPPTGSSPHELALRLARSLSLTRLLLSPVRVPAFSLARSVHFSRNAAPFLSLSLRSHSLLSLSLRSHSLLSLSLFALTRFSRSSSLSLALGMSACRYEHDKAFPRFLDANPDGRIQFIAKAQAKELSACVQQIKAVDEDDDLWKKKVCVLRARETAVPLFLSYLSLSFLSLSRSRPSLSLASEGGGIREGEGEYDWID